MSVRFNVAIEAPDCVCAGTGADGTSRHTKGLRTLFSQKLYNTTRPVTACPNHKHLYLASTSFTLIQATEIEAEKPLLKTVHIHSRQTGVLRTLVVRRAVSGQPVWYVQSDSGNEYLVQHRRNIWLCECKHFIARAFGRNETCHHIEGVRQADPEASAIESGIEPRTRFSK